MLSVQLLDSYTCCKISMISPGQYLFKRFFGGFIFGGAYHKISTISPGLYFFQNAFFVGFFSGKRIFGGAYYFREFSFQNELGLTIKTA